MSVTTSDNPITLRTTTNPSPSDLDTFIDLLSQSYLSVPLTTAFISEIDSTRTPDITPSRLKQHFQLGISKVAQSNIILTFAYTSTQPTTPIAAALFEPPSFTGIPPSHARSKPGPILTSYRTLAASLKSKYLSIPESGPKSYSTPAAPSQSSAAPSEDPYPADFNKEIDVEIRPIYHLSFVARDRSSHVSQYDALSAVTKIVKSVQDRAREEDVAIWLTTSEVTCRGEFEGMGFKVLEEALVGKGFVGRDGRPGSEAGAGAGAGGEGVKVWALYWE